MATPPSERRSIPLILIGMGAVLASFLPNVPFFVGWAGATLIVFGAVLTLSEKP